MQVEHGPSEVPKLTELLSGTDEFTANKLASVEGNLEGVAVAYIRMYHDDWAFGDPDPIALQLPPWKLAWVV